MFGVFKKKYRPSSLVGDEDLMRKQPQDLIAGDARKVKTLSLQYYSESLGDNLPAYGNNVQFKSFRAEEEPPAFVRSGLNSSQRKSLRRSQRCASEPDILDSLPPPGDFQDTSLSTLDLCPPPEFCTPTSDDEFHVRSSTKRRAPRPPRRVSSLFLETELDFGDSCDSRRGSSNSDASKISSNSRDVTDCVETNHQPVINGHGHEIGDGQSSRVTGDTAAQNQKAVTACFSSKQLQHSGFAEQNAAVLQTAKDARKGRLRSSRNEGVSGFSGIDSGIECDDGAKTHLPPSFQNKTASLEKPTVPLKPSRFMSDSAKFSAKTKPSNIKSDIVDTNATHNGVLSLDNVSASSTSSTDQDSLCSNTSVGSGETSFGYHSASVSSRNGQSNYGNKRVNEIVAGDGGHVYEQSSQSSPDVIQHSQTLVTGKVSTSSLSSESNAGSPSATPIPPPRRGRRRTPVDHKLGGAGQPSAPQYTRSTGTTHDNNRANFPPSLSSETPGENSERILASATGGEAARNDKTAHLHQSAPSESRVVSNAAQPHDAISDCRDVLAKTQPDSTVRSESEEPLYSNVRMGGSGLSTMKTNHNKQVIYPGAVDGFSSDLDSVFNNNNNKPHPLEALFNPPVVPLEIHEIPSPLMLETKLGYIPAPLLLDRESSFREHIPPPTETDWNSISEDYQPDVVHVGDTGEIISVNSSELPILAGTDGFSYDSVSLVGTANHASIMGDYDMTIESGHHFNDSLDSRNIILSDSFLNDSLSVLELAATISCQGSGGSGDSGGSGRGPGDGADSASICTTSTSATTGTTTTTTSSGEAQILVEEDYVPSVDLSFHGDPLPSFATPRPSSASWGSGSSGTGTGAGFWQQRLGSNGLYFPGYRGGNMVVRTGSFRSDISSSTITDLGHTWQARPALWWDSQDVSDWCNCRNMNLLAQILADKNFDGKQLLELTDPRLADLGVSSAASRDRILSEITKVRERSDPTAPIWNIKEVSVRRRTLEVSNELLHDCLSNLQRLNNQQQHRISSSLQELHEQQRAADELLQGTPVPSTPSTSSDVTESKGASSVPSIPSTPSTPGPGHTPATSSQHSREASSSGVSLSLAESTSSMVPVSVKQVPLFLWTVDDVTMWLTSVGLDKFQPTFIERQITGKQLAAIDMKLLDDLQIVTTEDRELILSRLYDLQQPTTSATPSPVTTTPRPSPPTPARVPLSRNVNHLSSESLFSKIFMDERRERPFSVSSAPRDLADGASDVTVKSSKASSSSSAKKKKPFMEDNFGPNFTLENEIDLQRELLLLKQSLFERDQKIGQLEADLSKSQKRSPRQSTSGDECQISPEKMTELEESLSECRACLKKREADLETQRSHLLQQLTEAKAMLDPNERVSLLSTKLEETEEHISRTHGGDENKILLAQQRSDISEALGVAKYILSKTKRPPYTSLSNMVIHQQDKEPRDVLQLRVETVVLGTGGHIPFLLSHQSEDGSLVVSHAEDGCSVRKGDRLVEVNEQPVGHLTDTEVVSLLRDSAGGVGGSVTLVVARPAAVNSEEDWQAVQDDLSLAVMELDATQQESSDLTAKIRRLQQTREEEADKCEVEVEQLRVQLDTSESRWSKLQQTVRRWKENGGNSPLLRLLSLQDESFNTSVTSPSSPPTGKKITEDSEEPREGLDWLHSLVNGDTEDSDKVLAYEDFSADLPLWETMKGASKNEVLQALKDHILETDQQKVYLDGLLSAVIEEAPQILVNVDTRLGLREAALKSNSEELC